MKNWFRNFMSGRYGIDNFGNFLFVVYLILAVLSIFVPYVYILMYVVLIYELFRVFSRNIYQRQSENNWYLARTSGIRKWGNRQVNKWKYRKTHKYLKCPYCHQYLRVPKGKGAITITCPKCHQSFDRRT